MNFKYMKREIPSTNTLSIIDVDRIIEMAWEDRTPFEAIAFQFSLSEMEVVALMRKNLKRSSLAKRNPDITRFKCALQRSISMNKISKR
jgi:Protein of unknown function (DUF2805)